MKGRSALIAVLVGLGLTGSALASSSLSGKYRAVIKNDTALGGALNGTWAIKFSSGRYRVTDNGHPVVHGRYRIKGDVITIKDTGGPAECPSTGKYTFKLRDHGRKLTFRLISDSSSAACIGRQDVITHRTFTKV